MKNIAVLLLLLSMATGIQAQNGGELKLMTKIVDSFTHEGLMNARVQVFEADSTTSLCDEMDISVKSTIGSRRWLEHYMKILPRRRTYVLKATAEGYEPVTIRLKVPSKWLKEYTAKDITMRRRDALTERHLGEAQVTASRVAMVTKGDTIIYDARAFRLAEGSMLDNLMKMMPGMVIDENGQITVNGKKVDELLVNGRNFFKGNPKVALDNLPAYTVDKIKAYHKSQRWDYLNDDRNKQREWQPYVVDVGLKREYAEGWLANFEAAGGSSMQDADDRKWMGRVFAMRYTDHSGLALYGNANNLGDKQSPGRKGEWKKNDPTQGNRTIRTGGVNFSIDGRQQKAVANTMLEVSREDTDLRSRRTQSTRFPTLDQLTTGTAGDDTGLTTLDWNGTIDFRMPKLYLSLEPAVRYEHGNTLHRSQTDVRTRGLGDDDPWATLYTRGYAYESLRDYLSAGLGWLVRFKSPLTGKQWSLNGKTGYEHTGSDATTTDDIGYDDGRRQHTWRHDDMPGRKYFYDARLGRSFVEKYRRGLGVSLRLSYRYGQRYESGRRLRETDNRSGEDGGNEEADALPSAAAAGEAVIDLANSYRTERLQREHSPEVYFSIGDNNRKGRELQVKLPVDFTYRDIRDTRNGQRLTRERKDVAFRPDIVLKLNRNALLRYNCSTDLPDLLHLLDVRDQPDPLTVYRGNTALKTTVHHRLTAYYGRTWRKRQRNFNVNATGTWTRRALGMARTYDTQTGVTTSQPLNIDGNRRGYVQAAYGQALDRKGRLMLAANSTASLARSVDFASVGNGPAPVKSVVHNLRIVERLKLDYRTTDGLHVGAKAELTHMRQTSDRAGFQAVAATDYSYGATLTWPVAKHVGLETDMMAYARRGYTDRSLNKTEWVWNAAVSYTFGRKKAWLLRAVGFDLLHQLANVRREQNEQGYVETWYNATPAYATLHLVYRLDIQPRKK